MTPPLISVIVPCYMVEKYLDLCINSIIGQTYTNLEIILVDDGSTDQSGVICDNYAAKDNRIKVIHKKNGGLSDARNVAIDICQGEYITFIDSDDTVSKDHIETLYSLIEKYQCKLSVGQWQTYKEGTKLKIEQPRKKEILYKTPQEAVTAMFYQEEFDNAACVKLYHRSLFDGIRFPKGLLFEDDYTVYQLLFRSDKVAYSNHITYYYLLRADSIEGSTFSEKKMNSALAIFKSMEEEHYDLISQVLPAYRSRYLSFCMHLILKAPDNFDKIDELWKRVKKYRLHVIFDSRARKKARIAALLSYFGTKPLKCAFKLVDKRQ